MKKYIFTDYREMLELKELDAVSICTPNHVHANAAICALNSGKHVLCEKPMAIDAIYESAKTGREVVI